MTTPTSDLAEQERREKLNAMYAEEPWGALAIACGFSPYDTEGMAREAFAACAARLTELEAEVSRLREREKVLAEALRKPVTDEEWSAAYIDMFSLTMGDEASEVETLPNQRGAIITQILLRRRAAALVP